MTQKNSTLQPIWRLLSAVLAIITPLSTLPMNLMAASDNSAISSIAQPAALTPPVTVLQNANSLKISERIIANRTVPKITEPPLKDMGDYTEDDDFFRGHVFAEPLVAKKSKTSLPGNKKLAHAMDAFSKRTDSNDFSAVEQFVKDNPDSGWSISILSNLATSYFKAGYFTKALATWEKVWRLGKDETDPDLKMVVDRAVAELAKMNARVGRYDRMESLFKEVGNRELRGSATEIMVGAKEALSLMKNHPEDSFRCGPMALGSLLALSKGKTGVDQGVGKYKSTSRGTSLAQLAGWAKELGMDYQVAKRSPGAAVITPCVVNWKVGHYACMVSNDNGVLHVQDPTFAEDLWIRTEALDAEASGYFLIPSGPLPEGWTPVEIAEAKNVWGKGQTSDKDPDRCDPCEKKAKGDCGSCGGMAKYDVHLMQVSLNITDTPVFYSVPVGPSADFTLTYNQRESHQPGSGFDYANFGNKWTCNLVSYITDNPTYLPADAKLYVQGGGARTFKYFNSTTSSYAAEYRTRSVLVRTSTSPISYELRNIDGSKQVFSAPNGTTTAGRKVFLTQTIDPMGNVLTYSYLANSTKIIAVTDAKGQVTTIEYKSNTTGTPDYYRIGKITNPFGKFATFDYNASGQLSVITDMIGIYSAFQYGPGDFINTMTTPYGATLFAYGDSGQNPPSQDETRWLEVTDPHGAKERVEYKRDATGIAFSEPASPTTLPSPGAANYWLNYRNTFYWSKRRWRVSLSEASQLIPTQKLPTGCTLLTIRVAY